MASIHCGTRCAPTARNGRPTCARSPRRRTARGGAPLWLVTTPLQLSAFQRGSVVAPGEVERVIVATMPLAQSLAAEARARLAHARRRDLRQHRMRRDGDASPTVRADVTCRRRASSSASWRTTRRAVARAAGCPQALDDRSRRSRRRRLRAARPARRHGEGRRQAHDAARARRAPARAVDRRGRRRVLHGRRPRTRVGGGGGAGAHGATLLAELARRVDRGVPAAATAAGRRRCRVMHRASSRAPRCCGWRLRTRRDGVRAAHGTIERQHVFPRIASRVRGHFPGVRSCPALCCWRSGRRARRRTAIASLGCDSAKFLSPVRRTRACTAARRLQRSAAVPFEIAVAGRVGVRGVFRCEPRHAAATAALDARTHARAGRAAVDGARPSAARRC